MFFFLPLVALVPFWPGNCDDYFIFLNIKKVSLISRTLPSRQTVPVGRSLDVDSKLTAKTDVLTDPVTTHLHHFDGSIMCLCMSVRALSVRQSLGKWQLKCCFHLQAGFNFCPYAKWQLKVRKSLPNDHAFRPETLQEKKTDTDRGKR